MTTIHPTGLAALVANHKPPGGAGRRNAELGGAGFARSTELAPPIRRDAGSEKRWGALADKIAQEMRRKSQLLASARRSANENLDMKTPVILLLTNDPQVEETVALALNEIGGLSHLACCASEALETACAVGDDLLLAVIDFEHGFDRLNLVQAIRTHCGHLPVVVIAPNTEKYMEVLASAGGPCMLMRKPVSAAQIAAAIKFCLPRQAIGAHRLTI